MSTIVNVRLWAFQSGCYRKVVIPDVEGLELWDILERVFHFGQNDFQPVPDRCSVSVGDVIEWQGNNYGVAPLGFRRLTEEEYDAYLQAPLKMIAAYSWEPNLEVQQ